MAHVGVLVIRTALGFFVACVTVGPVTFMLADREPPFHRIEGSIEPSALHSGDEFMVHWKLHVNQHKQCSPYKQRPVTRTIVDSAGGIKDMEIVNSVVGPGSKPVEITRKIVLPMGLTSGPARYHAEACFVCNPLQALLHYPTCITEPDIMFTVLPHE